MNSKLPPPAPSLRAIVVVPARDESALIERCLERLAAQHGIEPGEHETIVVLDGCRDATPALVAAFARRACARGSAAVHAVELHEPAGVGRARRTGMDLARDRLMAIGRPDGLIATTDADTLVAHDWLAAQLALVAGGARAIGGDIELDRSEASALHPQALDTRALRARRRLEAMRAAPADVPAEHPHFSGASLSLTAATYDACGGLPVRAALEDEALEHALAAQGISIRRSAAVRVRTSARRRGRAPRGLGRDLAHADWRARRTSTAADYPLERLLGAKRASVALILPAREVAATIGPIARAAARLERAGLLDEVLVVDAASRDGSARLAGAEGVRVVQENDLLADHGPVAGKGDAMWRALSAVESEIVAFADTDTTDFDPALITGILGPLLCEPGVRFVKGAFRRPFRAGGTVDEHGGGRVTEILARPLLNLHAPELAVFDQPLAGETAATRELLEALPFCAGYGVEIGLLIDAWRLAGLDAMAQVDLGVRQNRHQPLRELSVMAYAVLAAAQARFLGEAFADAHICGRMMLPPRDGGAGEVRAVAVEERAPLATLRLAPTERGAAAR